MMVDLTTDDLNKIESRTLKKRKADGEQTTLKDMIARKKITILETRSNELRWITLSRSACADPSDQHSNPD